MPQIRPLALAIIRKGDALLLGASYDPVRQLRFYRPPGGGIEFGETGAQAIQREMREEIAAELLNVRYLTTMENIFTYKGAPGHEIVLLYTADLRDPTLYDPAYSCAVLDAPGAGETICWRTLAQLELEGAPLYPDGLLNLLTLA